MTLAITCSAVVANFFAHSRMPFGDSSVQPSTAEFSDFKISAAPMRRGLSIDQSGPLIKQHERAISEDMRESRNLKSL